MRTKIGEGNNGTMNDTSPQENDPTTEGAMPAATRPTEEKPSAPAASVVENAMNPATPSTSRKKQKVKTTADSSTTVTTATTAVPAAAETQSASPSAGFPTPEAMTAVLRKAVLKVAWCVACLPETAHPVHCRLNDTPVYISTALDSLVRIYFFYDLIRLRYV